MGKEEEYELQRKQKGKSARATRRARVCAVRTRGTAPRAAKSYARANTCASRTLARIRVRL
eukprot:984632-Pleurochrysis_carterae.AAC.1